MDYPEFCSKVVNIITLRKFFLIPNGVFPHSMPVTSEPAVVHPWADLVPSYQVVITAQSPLSLMFTRLKELTELHPPPVYAPCSSHHRGTFHWTPSCMSASVLCCKPRRIHQEGTHHCWGPVKDPFPFLLYCAFQRTTFTQVFVQQTCSVWTATLPFSTFWQTSQLMSSGNTPGVLQSNPSSRSLMKATNFTGSTASLWKIPLLTGPHAAITTFWTQWSNQFSMHFMVYIPYISLVWLQGVSGRPCQRPWLNVELPSPLHHCRKQSSWLSTICPWYICLTGLFQITFLSFPCMKVTSRRNFSNTFQGTELWLASVWIPASCLAHCENPYSICLSVIIIRNLSNQRGQRGSW